jgi:hypothetical protein
MAAQWMRMLSMGWGNVREPADHLSLVHAGNFKMPLPELQAATCFGSPMLQMLRFVTFSTSNIMQLFIHARFSAAISLASVHPMASLMHNMDTR